MARPRRIRFVAYDGTVTRATKIPFDLNPRYPKERIEHPDGRIYWIPYQPRFKARRVDDFDEWMARRNPPDRYDDPFFVNQRMTAMAQYDRAKDLESFRSHINRPRYYSSVKRRYWKRW